MVTRFDAARGFGFVALDTGGEAFLHISALQRFGADTVAPKSRMRVRIGQGQKGPQVVEVVGIDGADRDVAGAEPMRGTVKWYNSEKGFGFVALESGGPDVFVHATALQRSGLPALTEGQAVKVRVIRGKKGPEVEALDID